MDKRDSAAQTVRTSALLSGQLDGLMAAWERSIASGQAAASGVGGGAPGKDPAALLAELEREAGVLEGELADLRAQADAERRLAGEWEGRAMISLRDGRDDLAQQAVRRQNEHASAGQALTAEVQATGEVVAAYRNAIATIRAALQPAAQ